MSAVVGKLLKPDTNTSLQDMIDMGLGKFIDKLVNLMFIFFKFILSPTLIWRLDEISGSASKEYSLEKALTKMKEDWKAIAFDLIQYRETVILKKQIII